MRRDELVELAKVLGIDLAAVELNDAELEVVVGGLSKPTGGAPGTTSGGGALSKLIRGGGSSTTF